MATSGAFSDSPYTPGKRQHTSFRDIVSFIVPDNREKALKQAITNALAIFLVIVILGVIMAIYIVLTPFLRPLVWALLFGSVLHPLKRSLSLSTQQWLNDLKDNEMPILVGLLLAPFGLVNNSTKRLKKSLYQYKNILLLGDRIFIRALEGYVDAVSSACVISFMVVIVIFTALYLSFQIYAESFYLIEKIRHSINSILIDNPDLKQLLPDGFTGVNSLLDDAVNNTYIHGREWIKSSTRQLLNNAAMENFNKTQSKIIEKQMVEFWDRAYILWLRRRDNGTVGSSAIEFDHIPYDWNRLFDALQSLNLSLCLQIVKQNINTLVSVADSIMSVVRGNISLVLGAITAALSVVVVGGNALVNFIINLIIFTTALFYLLCASGENYMPLQLINNIMPDTEEKSLKKLRGRTGFLESVNESVNAVFAASFKMMAFHGLFTWLLHNLFELEVVYLPSVISAILGAVPFLAPYWASIPAIVDLWLSGLKVQSIMMAILATVPSSFVSTAFYSEIKGAGHPYLTGLAIAGGVLVFGIEGALFGPMLLVVIRLLSLVVIYFMDVYS